MAQTRNPSSDFNHAIRDAKKQRSGVAGEVSDAAETSTAASQVADATQKARGTPPVRLRKRYATPSKISRYGRSNRPWSWMAAEECTARFDPVGIPLARKLERNNGQKSGMFNLIATTPWKRAKFSVPENLLYANSCPKLCFTQTGIARRQLVAKRTPPKGGEKIKMRRKRKTQSKEGLNVLSSCIEV